MLAHLSFVPHCPKFCTAYLTTPSPPKFYPSSTIRIPSFFLNFNHKTSPAMTSHQKLRQIKLLHTIIWAVMAAAILYLIYSGWSGRISTLTYLALGLIGMEVVVLLANKMVCPMTPMAREFSDSQKPNFDIYLPEWLAKYNKEIFGTLLGLGVALLIWRLLIA